jgi:hypothetical protein
MSLTAQQERASLQTWQERLRNPSLTVLLLLQLFLMFLALPLAARGTSIADRVGQSLLLVVLTLVVMLSHRRIAIAIILLGIAATVASVLLGGGWSPMIGSALNRGGIMLVFSALTWVVAYAVYAPGRITYHRLQGAVVIYLSLATIFAAAFSLVWELIPDAFANLPIEARSPREFATLLYFSLATLTTTGYGDIVPLDPFARSLANLESVIGQFYLATTVARLVTLELAHRRRGDLYGGE